jgi:hypothetical protein
MAQTTSRINTLQSVQNVLNARKQITEAMEGSFQVLTVRGSGNVIPVKTKDGENVPAADGSGLMLEKKLFNLVCNSAIAIKNPRNQAILREAYAAEKAGDATKAAELYNQYLNKTQVSISVLSTTAMFDRIQDGDQIKGKVQKITTENGSILTLDPKSLSIKEAGYGDDTKVDLFAMALSEDAPVHAEEVTAPVTAEA